MDCVNHSGVRRHRFLPELRQGALRGLRAQRARRPDSLRALLVAWQSLQQPFVAPAAGAPEPGRGRGPGAHPRRGRHVQRPVLQGPDHVVIFAVLISITDHYGIFGIFIGAWVLYQSFEAYHTARARRDGQPLPDPLGLNEVGNWLNLGGRSTYPGQQPPAGPWRSGCCAPGWLGQGRISGALHSPLSTAAGGHVRSTTVYTRSRDSPIRAVPPVAACSTCASRAAVGLAAQGTDRRADS